MCEIVNSGAIREKKIRISIATRKKTLPVPDSKYEFTPYIYATEQDNPAYCHYSTLYSSISTDSVDHSYENICGHNVIDFIGLENLEDKITVDRLISTATWEELSVVKLKKAN